MKLSPAPGRPARWGVIVLLALVAAPLAAAAVGEDVAATGLLTTTTTTTTTTATTLAAAGEASRLAARSAGFAPEEVVALEAGAGAEARAGAEKETCTGGHALLNRFGWADYSVLATMLIVSVGIGMFYACCGADQKTSEDFLLGGSSMGTFPMAMSLAARWVGYRHHRGKWRVVMCLFQSRNKSNRISKMFFESNRIEPPLIRLDSTRIRSEH